MTPQVATLLVRMDSQRATSIPILDLDIARRIVGCLSMHDIISISQSCRSFWELSCGVSRLCCSLSAADRPNDAAASFHSFLQRRYNRGMEVSWYTHQHWTQWPFLTGQSCIIFAPYHSCWGSLNYDTPRLRQKTRTVRPRGPTGGC